MALSSHVNVGIALSISASTPHYRLLPAQQSRSRLSQDELLFPPFLPKEATQFVSRQGLRGHDLVERWGYVRREELVGGMRVGVRVTMKGICPHLRFPS